MNPAIFETLQLDHHHHLLLSYGLDQFKINYKAFQALWQLHPADYHTLWMHGKVVKTPRWQQAYGKNYRFAGAENKALPISAEMQTFLDWCRTHIDERLNGLLMNWYDGQEKHYIGAHRDDTRDLLKDSPIVTISLGEERIFRMRPYKGKGYKDIKVRHGDVLVIPAQTNRFWTHEVPHFSAYKGKRISVTLRAFV